MGYCQLFTDVLYVGYIYNAVQNKTLIHFSQFTFKMELFVCKEASVFLETICLANHYKLCILLRKRLLWFPIYFASRTYGALLNLSDSTKSFNTNTFGTSVPLTNPIFFYRSDRTCHIIFGDHSTQVCGFNIRQINGYIRNVYCVFWLELKTLRGSRLVLYVITIYLANNWTNWNGNFGRT